MFRALFELIVLFVIAMAARAILRSVMQSVANAARNAQSQSPPPGPTTPPRQPQERVTVAGELHKDPVCGMYVAETTGYQRHSGRETFYYCSEQCKDKHALAAKI
jgi:YHS domain-containing protein